MLRPQANRPMTPASELMGHALRSVAVGWGVLAAVSGMCLAEEARPAALVPPTFEQLASNVVARSKWERTQNTTAQFTFGKSRVFEEFDSKGRLEDSKRSRQEWFPIDGKPFARLVERNGQPLTDKERKAEEEREAAVRAGQKPARSPEASKRDKEWQFTEEMLARYTFKVTGQEIVRGRPAWVVEFAPRSKDLPVRNLPDRVANKVAGKVWVDAEDWELARMKFWLTDEVSLIGGIVGVLRRFELLLERTRVEPNAWLPTIVDFNMAGRELLVSKRIHYREDAKDFKRVMPAPAVAAPNTTPAGGQ